VGYIFAVLFATVFYVLIGYMLNALLSENSSTLLKLAQEVGITVVLVLSFPYIKSRFDKITNKLFFQDSYDSQSFMSELNKEIVADIELESLLTKCSEVMKDNLKSSFCVFYIRETAYFSERFIGSAIQPLKQETLDKIKILSSKIHQKAFSTEQDTSNEDEIALGSILKDNNIEVLGRLVSTLEYEVSGIGYIFFGQKKSGSSYTTNDLKIIEIICNELVIATENALRLEEIEQFNVTLQKKIDDATKELQASNEKLKALDEAKDEFVSMASHQLRTPLTSIKGYLSMVVEGDAGEVNPTQKQMLGQALFSSQRMVYLISDLLNVSRLKTGKFVIEAKPTSLPEVVETELNQLYDGANAKNITLSFDKPSKFPILNLDEMKVRQVIMNFTDNAIYYTPNGGKITVALKDKRDSIEFTVKDTGIGVPKAERHKLFAKFYRAENARKARPDGTGLGLFMAKKVIVAQGGSILFDSKEGKGSTFGFSFPKKHLVVTPDAPSKAKQ
jgi:signal transduction histidine kinase